MNLYSKFSKLPRFIVETLTPSQLNEIVNMQRTYTNSNDVFDKKALWKERSNLLDDGGSAGAYGGGFVDKGDPHIFNKTTFNVHGMKNLKRDAYYQYIKISSKWAKSNPFLPRVYLVNLDKDNANNRRPSYKIEALSSIHDVKDCDQLIQIGYSVSKKLGDSMRDLYDKHEHHTTIEANNKKYTDVGYDNKSQKDEQGHKINRVIDGELPKQMINMLEQTLDGIITGTDRDMYPYFDDTVTPQMQQVLKIINFLRDKYYFGVDIHDENFMIRRTPYGPQLVITDPLT